MSEAQPLPRLRQDLALYEAPAALDGSPSWTLHDPVRNLFLRLGWAEFEILSCWHLNDAQAIAAHVAEATTLSPLPEDVMAVAAMLTAHDLIEAHGPAEVARLTRRADAARMSWAKWLLKNYLFVRLPLARPDRFLEATMARVSFLFSKGFLLGVAALGVVGLYLAMRRWDEFTATFQGFLSVEGLGWYAVTLAFTKCVHELGHAYAAKRAGCRVPTMGVALLVMYPVLYTDTSEAWKLRSRRQRLTIDMAGVLSELVLAALALFLWSFLPDGPARSAAFLVATGSWVATLAINLSPFMRFDGYFVLCDLLNMHNLHPRSFAVARWWLRGVLFGLHDPPPEPLSIKQQRFMIAFALAIWVYRVVLFLGIALLVYHAFFKVLGLFLMAVEIGWFILRPVGVELMDVWKRRADLRPNRQLARTIGIVLVVGAIVAIPWQTLVEAPGVLRPRDLARVFAESPSRVDAVLVSVGERVTTGQRLMRLASPELEFQHAALTARARAQEWALANQGFDDEVRGRNQVLEQERRATLARLSGIDAKLSRLDVRAAMDGVVVEVPDAITPGIWVKAGEPLARLARPGPSMVDAFISEDDLARIAKGARATFHPDVPGRPVYKGSVVEIDGMATRILAEPHLASTYGGKVAVRPDPKTGQPVPEGILYRTRIMLDDAPPLQPVLRGTAVIEGQPASILDRIIRAAMAVLIRESGA